MSDSDYNYISSSESESESEPEPEPEPELARTLSPLQKRIPLVLLGRRPSTTKRRRKNKQKRRETPFEFDQFDQLDGCFPGEIIFNILVRLPVESVIKCSGVCKSWNRLIKSSTFFDAHLTRTIQSNHHNNAHFLLLRELGKGYWLLNLYWEKKNPSATSASAFGLGGGKFINPFTYIWGGEGKLTAAMSNFTFVGTCNGLVCLTSESTYVPTVIWNPSVRKYVDLPCPPNDFSCPPTFVEYNGPQHTWAFGYDSLNNDYKVLRIVGSEFGGTPFGVEVYSLARNSWKTLRPTVYPAYFNPSYTEPDAPNVFVNGALHWVQPKNEDQEGYLILSFDVVTESFHEIMMPPDFNCDNEDVYPSILRYGESLALIRIEEQEDEISGEPLCDLQIWVMEQHGVAESSWTKLYSVRAPDIIPYVLPLGFKSSCELVIKTDSSTKLQTVDLKTNQVQDFVTGGTKYDCMDSFVESLFLLGHPNAISYKVKRKKKQQKESADN